LIKFIFAIIVSITASAALSQVEDSEFRNDFRPKYNKSITSEQLSRLQASGDVIVLDVRLTEDFNDDPILIPGAVYKNPDNITTWINEIEKDKEVVVYCVAGKWVSQKAAHILDQAGISVKSLDGGIKSWKSSQDQ
jgi:rhodanese-related sulfurtransferase